MFNFPFFPSCTSQHGFLFWFLWSWWIRQTRSCYNFVHVGLITIFYIWLCLEVGLEILLRYKYTLIRGRKGGCWLKYFIKKPYRLDFCGFVIFLEALMKRMLLVFWDSSWHPLISIFLLCKLHFHVGVSSANAFLVVCEEFTLGKRSLHQIMHSFMCFW